MKRQELAIMSETVASSQSLPELIMGMITAETVKICEDNGVITLIPLTFEQETHENDPTANWTAEQWEKIGEMLDESERDFENGNFRDAFEVLEEARIKYGL